MARMIGPMFIDSPLLLIPLGVLVLFVTVFATAAVRAWRSPAEADESIARLPLDSDEEAQ